MRAISALIFSIFSAGLLFGCGTNTSARYAISVDNNLALKKLEGCKARVVSIKAATAFLPICRGGVHIQPPDGMTISQYIEKAINDEFKSAGIYASQGGIELYGSLTRSAFSSTAGVTKGWWDLAVAISSGKGRTISIQNLYEFDTGFEGVAACNQIANAFGPAVQDLINKLVTDPQFAQLLK